MNWITATCYSCGQLSRKRCQTFYVLVEVKGGFKSMEERAVCLDCTTRLITKAPSLLETEEGLKRALDEETEAILRGED